MLSEVNFHGGWLPGAEGVRDQVSQCESILERMLTKRGTPLLDVDRLLARDPESVCAHNLRAALIIRADDPAARPALAASIAALEAASPDLDHRVRRHAAAARAWLEGTPVLAVKRYNAIVADWPHDIVALSIAHALDFRLDRRRAMAKRFARVLSKWNADLFGYANVLAMYAFALEENGQYDRAEKLARRALALEYRNPYAIHVIAHVMEMQGRADDGLAFLEANEAVWSEKSGLSVHLAWHRALFELDANNPKAALATYDARIASARSPDMSTLADASALLWRFQLKDDVDVKQRWQKLADRWEMQTLEGARGFYVVHAMMAFAVARRRAAATRLIEAVKDRAIVGPSHPLREEALVYPFCEALLAFVRRDYPACLSWLERVRHIARHCGGSLAQCDLIHCTFTEAALRAKRTQLARALVKERTAQNPSGQLNHLLDLRLSALQRAAA